jgi:hypothetical protein
MFLETFPQANPKIDFLREHLPGTLPPRVQAGNRVLKRYCKNGGDDYNVAFFGKPSL